MISPAEFRTQVDRCRAAGSNTPVRTAVHVFVLPRYDEGGTAVLTELCRAAADDPVVADGLVGLSDRRDIPVLTLIPEEVVLQEAARSLVAPSDERRWALYALTYGEIGDEDRWRLVMRLIDMVPEDDEVLWMIGDGPVAALEMVPELDRRLAVTEQHNARLRHIRHLVRTLP